MTGMISWSRLCGQTTMEENANFTELAWHCPLEYSTVSTLDDDIIKAVLSMLHWNLDQWRGPEFIARFRHIEACCRAWHVHVPCSFFMSRSCHAGQITHHALILWKSFPCGILFTNVNEWMDGLNRYGTFSQRHERETSQCIISWSMKITAIIN